MNNNIDIKINVLIFKKIIIVLHVKNDLIILHKIQ